MTFIQVAVLILTLILFALILWGYLVWKKREKYTRERFAFVGLTTLSSMVLIVLTSLMVSETPWGIIYFTISKIFGVEHNLPEPGKLDYFLSFSLIVMMAFFIKSIHQSWDGAVSEQQKNRERYQGNSTIITEGYSELKRLVTKQKPFDIYEPENLSSYNLILDAPQDSLAWHRNAKELLTLRTRRFYFEENSYDDSECCWVGRNKRTNNTVLLRCSHTDPTEKEISSFIKYASRIASQNGEPLDQAELIWASKVGGGEPISYNGFEIQKETEESLIEDLVDFTDYFFEIKRRVETENLPNSKLTLNDVYVPSSFRLENSNKPGESNVEEFISDWLNEPGRKQLALLGEYGQGKSTCSLMLSYHLIKNSNNNPPRIPILIELRGRSPRTMTPEDLLAAWAHPYDINPNALMKLLIAGKLLLILEGFDEVDLSGDSEMRLAHFRQLWKFSYPKAKVLFTGRPNFFLDDSEMKAALGIRDFSLEKPYCQALSLESFNLDKMRRALRFLDQNVIDEIHGLAEKDEKFLEIASRPSLLYLIGILWERGNFSKYKDKINSAFVMDHYIRYSLQRQEEKVREGIRYMVLNSPEREYFMKGIAVYMVSKNLPNQINRDQFDEIVNKLFEAIPDSVSLTNAASGEDPRPLRIRKKDDEHLIKHIKTDVRTCGLLVADLSSSGSLKFSHKSFMEFLCADFWAQKILNFRRVFVGKRTSDSIIIATDAKINSILKYQEITSFFAEILSINSSSIEGGDQLEKAKFLFATIMDFESRFSLVRRIWLNWGKIYRVLIYILTSIFLFILPGLKVKQPDYRLFWQILMATFIIPSAVIVMHFFLRNRKFMIRENRILIKLFFQSCEALGFSQKIMGKVIGVKNVGLWKYKFLNKFIKKPKMYVVLKR